MATAIGGLDARAGASGPPYTARVAVERDPRARHAVRRERLAEHRGARRELGVPRRARRSRPRPGRRPRRWTDGYFLHPALAGCKQLWDDDRLAIVHGVGFDGLDRSHFHCADVWQAGSTDDLSTGWLGRWLDTTGGDPLDAVAVGGALPLALRGARRSAAVVPVGPIELPGGSTMRRRLTSLVAADAGRSPLAALVASTTDDLLDVVDEMTPVLASTSAPDELADDRPAATGRRTVGLGAQLDVVAASIVAGIPARVVRRRPRRLRHPRRPGGDARGAARRARRRADRRSSTTSAARRSRCSCTASSGAASPPTAAAARTTAQRAWSSSPGTCAAGSTASRPRSTGSSRATWRRPSTSAPSTAACSRACSASTPATCSTMRRRRSRVV